MPDIKSICVYCGSQPGNNADYLEAAKILGESMALNRIRLVYGGGGGGIMGEIARVVKTGGGEVLGIIPEFLFKRERGSANSDLGEVIITRDMHERKHTMFEKSDAFVALPGGIGTLEEIIEIMTWAQLGRHAKPIVFANVGGFWDPLLELISHMSEEGFIHTSNKVRPIVANDPAKIIEAVLTASNNT